MKADQHRISEMLDAVAAISETPWESGVTRIAFTELEREAHALFTSWMTDLGLTVRTDAVGNTIAEKPGSTGGRAIATGSHLDSVPRGGRFDGIVGSIGAAHAAELLVRSGAEHDHPIRFVVFVCEEGARFGQACVGSKAVGGMWTYEELEAKKDAQGVSIAEAMRSVGASPERVEEAAWDPAEWAAWLELHVEQGQRLEDQGLPLGIVDLISGSTRFQLRLNGVASHTGSTPMDLRHDALAAASEIVLAGERIANDTRHRGTRCTVGKMEIHPGSMTTIPGEVVMWIDVRDVDSGRQRTTADDIVREARSICDARGVSLEATLLSDASPVVLPAWLREVTAGAARDLGVEYRVMYSGASHDSQMVNNRVPAGMIFVPSRAGLSHVPEEWTSAAEIAVGVDVLTASLLRLDAHLTSQGL